MIKRKHFLALLTCVVMSNPSFAEESNSDGDYLEPINRVLFEVNDVLDGLFLTPFSKIYRGVFHEEVRLRIHYVLRNIGEPVVFANNLLQGEFEASGVTLGRFLTNSTVGLVGIFDVGDDWGMPYAKQDFGLTLSHWGAGHGSYLILPILGPSSLRDGTGRIVDVFLDPVTWLAPAPSGSIRTGGRGVDDFSDVQPLLSDLRENSVDYYVALRSFYFQNRLKQEGVESVEVVEHIDSPNPFHDED